MEATARRSAPRQTIPDIAPALLEKGAVTPDQMKAITLASQVGDFRRGIDPGDPTFKIAVLLGYAKSGEVAVEVAKALGIVTYVMVEGYPVDPHLPIAVPRDFIEKNLALPLVREGLLPQDRLQTTIAAAQAAHMPLGRYMVKTDMVDETVLFRTLAGMADAPFLEAPEAAALLKESTLRQRLKRNTSSST